MLNLFYESEEVYSYENEEQITKAIEFDSIGNVQLDKWSKSITYIINHRKSIRLRDLIFWIESDFVRIHLGQLFYLIIQLLIKVKLIESQGIEHNYLGLNRIWLHLTETSQHPNIIYQILHYQIHFTGYQCPFYENQNMQQKASIKVKEIIQIIINHCFYKIHFKWTDEDTRNQIFNQIFQPLINLCKSNSSNNDIIKYCQDIMNKHNYKEDLRNRLIQSLEIDDNINDYNDSNRHKAIPKVNQDLTSIIEFGKQYGQIVIESLLQQAIPKISQQLESYSKLKFDYMIIAQEQYQIIQKREFKLRNDIKESIKDSVQQILTEKEKDYKFDITIYEINQLEQEVIDSLFQSQFVKYFNNTYWLHLKNQDIHHRQIVAITKFIMQEVQEKVDQLFILKILTLINELI